MSLIKKLVLLCGLIASLTEAAHAEARQVAKTDVLVQLVFCNNAGADPASTGEPCIDPHYIRKARVVVKNGSSGWRVVTKLTSNAKGQVRFSIKPGVYSISLPWSRPACISGQQSGAVANGCRKYAWGTWDTSAVPHEPIFLDGSGLGRIVYIEGQTRRVVLKYFEGSLLH